MTYRAEPKHRAPDIHQRPDDLPVRAVPTDEGSLIWCVAGDAIGKKKFSAS